MTKILHLVLSLNVGGLEKFAIALSSNYSDNIVPVIACLDEVGGLGENEQNIKILALTNKSTSKVFKVIKVLQFLKNNKFDLIHTHNLAAHFYGAVASLVLGIPLVHTKHGTDYPKDFRKILIERFAFKFSKMIVGVSDDVKEQYIKQTGCSKQKITSILNGVDLACFNKIQQVAKSTSSVNIGIVARLSLEKDHRTLLKSFAIALNNNPDLRLTIVGDGPEMNNLQKLACNLSIANNVHFLGNRFDIPDVLSNLDIFVLSSQTEGISISLLEAMASGLPCIATDVGGNPEVIINNITGFIVRQENDQELANKILELASDPLLRFRMGSAGRTRVIEHFSVKETAKSYEHLYKLVLNNY